MAQEHVASKSDKHANATASLIELYEETNIYEPMLKVKRDAVKAWFASTKGERTERRLTCTKSH